MSSIKVFFQHVTVKNCTSTAFSHGLKSAFLWLIQQQHQLGKMRAIGIAACKCVHQILNMDHLLTPCTLNPALITSADLCQVSLAIAYSARFLSPFSAPSGLSPINLDFSGRIASWSIGEQKEELVFKRLSN